MGSESTINLCDTWKPQGGGGIIQRLQVASELQTPLVVTCLCHRRSSDGCRKLAVF